MSTLLQDFDYHRPASLAQLQELIKSLQDQKQSFIFSAGGTNIIPLLKTQLFKADQLISLSRCKELVGIEKKEDRIIIGAMTSLNDVSKNDLIRQYFPALALAAHKVASPQIRNRATIGGNIMVDNRCIYINQSSLNRESHSPCFKAEGDVCHLVKSAKRGDQTLCQARFVSDTAPLLLLLGAELNIIRQNDSRKIKLSDLYLKDGIDSKSLKPGEVITTIEVEIPKDFALTYEKLSIRNALDFPSLGVAVAIKDRAGNPDINVALTGLNTHPGVFRTKSEDHDTFERMVDDLCAQASDFAVTYQQDFFPRAYRKSMIPVFIRRGIEKIMKEANP